VICDWEKSLISPTFGAIIFLSPCFENSEEGGVCRCRLLHFHRSRGGRGSKNEEISLPHCQ